MNTNPELQMTYGYIFLILSWVMIINAQKRFDTYVRVLITESCAKDDVTKFTENLACI